MLQDEYLASMRQLDLVDQRDGSLVCSRRHARAVERDLKGRHFDYPHTHRLSHSPATGLTNSAALRDMKKMHTQPKHCDVMKPAGWELTAAPDRRHEPRHLVNDAALVALASDPDVYERGSALVHVVRGGKVDESAQPDSPRVASIPTPVLRERLTKAGRFVSTARKEDDLIETRNVHPPRWCVEAVHARGVYQEVRPLRRIIESPILRPDDHLGRRLRLRYQPTLSPTASPQRSQPTRRTRRCTEELLLDIVTDFPFVERTAPWLAATSPSLDCSL